MAAETEFHGLVLRGVCSSLLKRTTTCQNELIVQLLALVRTFWSCRQTAGSAVTRARQPRRSRSPCTVEL
jgi:hypothetical protein